MEKVNNGILFSVDDNKILTITVDLVQSAKKLKSQKGTDYLAFGSTFGGYNKDGSVRRLMPLGVSIDGYDVNVDMSVLGFKPR